MKTIFRLILPIMLVSSLFAAPKKGLTIDVELFPAGSFQIQSRLKGSLKKSGDTLRAATLTSKVSTFKTGMDLRDDHTKKALNYKKFPKVIVSDVKASNGQGVAKIKIMKTTKKIKFKYKTISSKYAQAVFNLSLKQFGIQGISFKGVGVEDKVKVTAVVKVK